MQTSTRPERLSEKVMGLTCRASCSDLLPSLLEPLHDDEELRGDVYVDQIMGPVSNHTINGMTPASATRQLLQRYTRGGFML